MFSFLHVIVNFVDGLESLLNIFANYIDHFQGTEEKFRSYTILCSKMSYNKNVFVKFCTLH